MGSVFTQLDREWARLLRDGDAARRLSDVCALAGADVELDPLAFVERLVARGLDVGEVDEHVVTIFTGDETEALLGIEELHGASSQMTFSSVTARPSG